MDGVLIGGFLEEEVKFTEAIETELVNVSVDKVFNESLFISSFPLLHKQVNMIEMNISSPVLENSCKLQFGILPLNNIIGLSLIDVENLMDMLFSLLGEENFLIGVEFVKDRIDQFINKLVSVNI